MKGEQHVFYTLLSLAVLLPLLITAGLLLSSAADITQDVTQEIRDIPPASEIDADTDNKDDTADNYNYTDYPKYTILSALIIFTIGTFIGSLAPDADAADSAIMHGLTGGKGTTRTARRHTVIILPFFGYLIRYLIYYPISALAFIVSLGRIKPRHRGLLHSLFGTVTVAVILTIYLWLISDLLLAAFFAAEITAMIDSYLPAFCAGIIFGAVMHLTEDSCTHSGVYWLFPFGKTKLSGTLTPKSHKNRLIAVLLGTAAIISLTFGNSYAKINEATGITETGTAITSSTTVGIVLPLICLTAAWITAFYISGTHVE